MGDVVQGGLSITNSETGLGCLRIQPMLLRLVCLNGLAVPDAAMNRRHVGVRATIAEGSVLYARDTVEADDRALVLKARDAVRAILTGGFMPALLDQLRAATEDRVEDPLHAAQEITRQFSLSLEE